MTMGMALGDGLLQELWYSDSSEDEGTQEELEDKASPTEAAEETGSGELAGKFQNHHQWWCVC